MNQDTRTSPPAPRDLGRVNWLGFWTLYSKEVRRFLKVHFQTLWAPVVTTLIFLAVFALALGGTVKQVAGVDFLSFLGPGLIMMAMIQNSFANTSSSLLIAKVQGNIVDLLMPPLSPAEQMLGVALGGVTRGLCVGAAVGAAMSVFVDMHVHALLACVYYAAMACLMLSLLGMIGGIWADKFDHMASVTNFVIMPLSFLSGTFYSIERLPDVFRALALANPFFYLIDGFRYGFIGHADGSLVFGAAFVALVNLALLTATYRMLATGYKLRD